MYSEGKKEESVSRVIQQKREERETAQFKDNRNDSSLCQFLQCKQKEDKASGLVLGINTLQGKSMGQDLQSPNAFSCCQLRRTKKYTRHGDFQGTDNVPVTRINAERVRAMLESALGHIRGESGTIRSILNDGFDVAAGIHSGGVGGGGYAPDNESHITIRSGRHAYHLHVHKGRITSITY